MNFSKNVPAKDSGVGEQEKTAFLSKDLKENIKKIKNGFGHSSDLIINNFPFGSKADLNCASIFIKGMADGKTISGLSLELSHCKHELGTAKPEAIFELLKNCFSGLRAMKEAQDYDTLYREVLGGNTAFLVDGCDKFFVIATNSNEGRAISEPTSQTTIKGPKDAFTESLEINIYLIRKRLRNRNLRLESITTGTVTHTNIKMVYLHGIAKEDVVEDIRSRLQRVDYDSVLDSNYIEEFIKTNRYSIFPTAMNSERPDAVVAALLEGKVAVLVDGTPYVLTAPALMVEFLQASEDYYHHFAISSLIRLLRYTSLLLTLLVPALFIAITTFHHEIVPTPLLISIAAQREGVPFPLFFEVVLMELTFEILREAGIRMPQAIGSAISIVGALVLGQASVEAGLISAAVVIVVSITAIASFAITNYGMSNAIRLLRFVLIILATILGLYGVVMGLIVMVLHLCSLKTAGVPYLSPIAPRLKGGNKDTIFRFPLFTMKYRPYGISAAHSPRTSGQETTDPSSKGKAEFR